MMFINKMKSILCYIKLYINKMLCEIRCVWLRKINTNKDFSIIANHCIGGVIAHNLGVRFNSPFVNLYIRPDDFIEICLNLPLYMGKDIDEVPTSLSYPVGRFHGTNLYIFFKHYSSFEYAKNKWNERKRRINYNNIYVICHDRFCLSDKGCSRFDSIPYKKKVLLSVKEGMIQNVKSMRLLKKNNELVCVGMTTGYVGITGLRLFEYTQNWNYFRWLNE